MIKHLLDAIHLSIHDSTDKEIIDAIKLIELAELARANAFDTIVGLFKNGPLYDGDVPSKTERDWLVQNGLASKVIYKGEDGYQALTYKGAKCYRIILSQKRFEVAKQQEGE